MYLSTFDKTTQEGFMGQTEALSGLDTSPWVACWTPQSPQFSYIRVLWGNNNNLRFTLDLTYINDLIQTLHSGSV